MFDLSPTTHCSRCKLEISAQRQRLNPSVCNHCGFTLSKKEALVKQEIERSSIMFMLVISAIVLSTYIQVMNWDRYSLDIIPITVKEFMGISTREDWNHKAQICFELKKWNCAETQYAKIALNDPSQYAQLGHFQMLRGKNMEAATSFSMYFQNGGQDLETAYSYAKVLSQLNRAEEAIRYFDMVLEGKTDTLQVTVIQNYVKLLIANHRYAHAIQLIENMRRRAPQANQFMEAEYRQINQLATASHD